MKKYDYIRVAPVKSRDECYLVVRTNQQEPALTRCKTRAAAELIVNALNAVSGPTSNELWALGFTRRPTR